MPRPICLRLFRHFIRAAASRTFWTAGSKRPTRTAMIAITTNSSISVNARRRQRNMDKPPDADEDKDDGSNQVVQSKTKFGNGYCSLPGVIPDVDGSR